MNPLYQSASGPNGATAPNNSLNDAAPSVRHTFNRFNNGYSHYTTANYGEYTPFFNQVCNPADSKKFKSVSQIRTLSLHSPLYSAMKMNKDYFFVPYDAILPNSWQKIYRNPSQGDDVPADANTVIPDVHVLFQFAVELSADKIICYALIIVKHKILRFKNIITDEIRSLNCNRGCNFTSNTFQEGKEVRIIRHN